MESIKNNITQINDIEYIYNVIMFNSDNKTIVLSQDAVQLLVINDTTMEPFASGFIIIDNSNSAIQRASKTKTNQGKYEEIEAAFDFNLADRDYIYIEIIPKFHTDQQYGDLDHETWNLRYLFTIFDTEDLDMPDSGDNSKKLYFADYQKIEMMDKTSNYSTALIERDDNIPQYLRDDSDRTETTGNIIKQLLTQSVSTPEFEDDWDDGGNKIFYTSPANTDYHSDLENIYRIHQSSVSNDMCILSKLRYSNVWKLESFENIVSKALDQTSKIKSGEYQLEAFSLADTADMPQIPLKSRVPTDYSIDKNFAFGDLSKIDNFRLVELSRQDINDNFKTIISNSYDFDNGKFKIQHSDIKTTKEFFDNKYANKLKGKSGIFKVGEAQTLNQNILHNYGVSYTPDTSFEFLSRNVVLRSAYILGIGIEFTTTGMTHRKSGTFFSIRKDHNYYDNDYEGKLQGQWFCTGVTHVFSGSVYTTDVMGIKLNISG